MHVPMAMLDAVVMTVAVGVGQVGLPQQVRTLQAAETRLSRMIRG